jgi:hypothetical protein
MEIMSKAGCFLSTMSAVLLLWESVTMDCKSRPEAVAHYMVRAQHIRLLGWSTTIPPFPYYSARAPQEGTTTVNQWMMSAEPLLPGDVVWWELGAVDVAGNMNDGSCPL